MIDDRWKDAAAYDRYMGRWSRALAERFVSWLAVPPGSAWLEIGCGTGALTRAIRSVAEPRSLTACDTSRDYVAYCREHVRDARVRFVEASTDALPSPGPGHDVVASSLVLNFLPDPAEALDRMRRACRERGTVAACVWDYAGEMTFLRTFWDAAVALDPGARPLDEGVRFPICSPPALRAAFAAAGLEAVEVAPLVVPTPFPTFEDFWEPFVTGPGPAPTYLASLSEARREALVDRLREGFACSPEGPARWTARAWAARGERKAA